VKDGYPPAERIDGDAVVEVGSRHTTKIRLYDSGRFTRIASVGVIALLLAGVIAFAAPKRWAPWTTLRGWGTNDAGPTSRSVHGDHLKTLDARAFQLLRPFTPPTLPSTRALRRVRRWAMPSKVAASSKCASTPIAAPTTATAVAPEPAFVDDESAAGAKPEETPDPTSDPNPESAVIPLSAPPSDPRGKHARPESSTPQAQPAS
jgi:hypothetical protein